MIQNTGSTQPSTPIAKRWRGRAFLLNTFILIVILVVAVVAGYGSGLSVRKQTQTAGLSQQLTEQFQFVDADMQAGRYEIAKQRLEFILSKDPSFPGAQDKLTEVLVQITLLQGVQSATPTPSLTPTPDFSGAEQAYSSAAQLIAAQDWPGALRSLDQLRKLDPNYQQSQVDGMYYFALRNYGYDLIIKQGNLEGGIYQITLAERFGPLDRDTNGLREGARVYLIGASFWELDWEQALFYFDQARNWGNLWDGTMTASQRYWFASMRRGDDLFAQQQYCDALAYYQNAQSISALDQLAQNNHDEAFIACFPATATIDLTAIITPTVEITVTTAVPDVPTNTPELPTETPTETPTTNP